MSKRVSTKDLDNKGSAKKKSKREAKESKWRLQFLKHKNPRIKSAVATSILNDLPIILIKDSPTNLVAHYTFWPKNQEIGESVLNLLEHLYNHGHVEENDDEYPKGNLASRDHIGIVERLCGSKEEVDEIDLLIDLYFKTTVDQIGIVKPVDDFSNLAPLLYFQPCYGYF